MEERFEPAGRLRLEPQGVAGAGLDPVVDIGPEVEHLTESLIMSILLHLEFDGEERRFFDD